jgi:hypothetical protein
VTSPALSTAPGILASAHTSTSGEVLVSWTAPTNSNRSPIVRYRISITAVGGGAKTGTHEFTVEGFPAPLNYVVTGLTVGKTYTFRIAAVNDVGLGSSSVSGGGSIVVT